MGEIHPELFFVWQNSNVSDPGAAIRLYHRPGPSGHALYGAVDGLDSGE